MHDLIIIGGGPAGLTAALYSARGGLRTLVFEKAVLGGKITSTDKVDNYPAIPQGVSGYELGDLMANQAKKYGAVINFEEVVSIDLKNDIKTVTTVSNTYNAKAIILAMGTNNRKLGLKEEDNLIGKGISYCATCDGAFFRGREVAIVGGANSAVTEALYLAGLASKVHIIYRRDKFKSESINTNKLLSASNITPHLNSEVTNLIFDEFLTGIELKNNKTNEISKLNVSGLFVAVGHLPNIDLVKDQVATDQKNYIITDDNMATNIKGVYAAGDIRSNTFRQVVTACGDGAHAANSAIEYINSEF